MTELNNPANCEQFPFPGRLMNLTFKQLVIIVAILLLLAAGFMYEAFSLYA
jgi:hypothetical protein